MSKTLKNLLWIDDDGEDRFPHECRQLRTAGYEIFWAQSGKEAAEQLRARSYEVILLDQQLPWKQGVSEVWGGVMLYAWATGSQRPGEAPPLAGFDELFKQDLERTIKSLVLVVSSFYDVAVEEARRDLGLLDAKVFSKPVDIQALLKLLHTEST